MLFTGKSHNTITFFIYRYADQVCSNDISAALITLFPAWIITFGPITAFVFDGDATRFRLDAKRKRFSSGSELCLEAVSPCRAIAAGITQYRFSKRLSEIVFISRLDFFLGRKRITMKKMLSMRKSLHKEIDAVFARQILI